jgi:hypothetical protein
LCFYSVPSDGANPVTRLDLKKHFRRFLRKRFPGPVFKYFSRFLQSFSNVLAS